MHVGALHLFELPAGSRGSFVNALRKHMAERLPLAPALRRRIVADAAEHGQSGLGRRRARPEAAHRRRQAAGRSAWPVRRDGAARSAGRQVAHPAARPQPAAVEVPRHRGPGRGRGRRKKGGDVHPVAPRRGRRPGRRGAGQCHPRPEPAPAAGRGAHLGPRQALRARPGRDDLGRHRQRGAADHAPDSRACPARSVRCRRPPRRWPRAASSSAAGSAAAAWGWPRAPGSTRRSRPAVRLPRSSLPLPELKALGRAARRHAQRHGADAVQRRVARALPQPRAAAAQVDGGRRTGLAARQGRHQRRQPGLDDSGQPGHPDRRSAPAAGAHQGRDARR